MSHLTTASEVYIIDRNGEISTPIAGTHWHRNKQQSAFGAVMSLEITDADRKCEKEFIEYQNKLRNDK